MLLVNPPYLVQYERREVDVFVSEAQRSAAARLRFGPAGVEILRSDRPHDYLTPPGPEHAVTATVATPEIRRFGVVLVLAIVPQAAAALRTTRIVGAIRQRDRLPLARRGRGRGSH